MDDSIIMEIVEVENSDSQKENKWDKWHPKALKTRVSNVLKPDIVTKSSVTSKLDKLSSARLELVQLQMDSTRKQQIFMEEEHKLKMAHLANDERRKEELHALLMEKIRCGPVPSGMI
ncbi:hypothetical protein evm_014722, partial [Chilo suppressalis]